MSREEYLQLITELTHYLLGIYECRNYISSPIAGISFYGIKELKKNIKELNEKIKNLTILYEV